MNHLLIAFLIFITRVTDVTLGTIKIRFISRGCKTIPPLLAFVEILIWLVAIRQIMINLDNPICFIAYALGYACGTYSGLRIEEKLASGILMVTFIINNKVSKITDGLKKQRFAYTKINAKGSYGKVDMFFSVIKRRDLKNFIALIEKTDPSCFYSVTEVHSVGKQVGLIPNISKDVHSDFRFGQFFRFGNPTAVKRG